MELQPRHDPGEHLELIVRPDLAAGDKPGIDIISALPAAPGDKFFQLDHHFFEVILNCSKKTSAGLSLLISLERLGVPDLVEQFDHVVADLVCCKHLLIILNGFGIRKKYIIHDLKL